MVAGEMPRPITQVTGYRVSCLPSDHPDRRAFTIEVQEREYDEGEFWWAVTCRSVHFDAEGQGSVGFQWPGGEPVGEAEMAEYERQRRRWLEAHRFTEAEALALARRLAPKMKTWQGHTVQDALDKVRKGRNEETMTEESPEKSPQLDAEGLGALEGIQWTGENESAVRGWLGDAFEKIRGGLQDDDPKVVWFRTGTGGSYLSWARPGDIIERRVDGSLHAYNPNEG